MKWKSKFKIGDKVVPHSKTSDGRVPGLHNSVVWQRANIRDQFYLYVTRVPLNEDDYQEYMLDEFPYNSQRSGDYFHEHDIESYEDNSVRIKITPVEAEILEHRLAIPDAIAESLEMDEDYVYDICFKFECQLKQGNIEYNDNYEKRIIEDCIEGSTFINGAYLDKEDENISTQKYNAYLRVYHSLCEKFNVCGHGG